MLDIILAGVGGQGILSIAYVLDYAALSAGLHFKQAEVHGMAQRGGAVQSHVRLAPGQIWSDLIPAGQVGLVLAVEPLEALRYAHELSPEGWVVSSTAPFVNISSYPDLSGVIGQIAALPRQVMVDAASLAQLAGNKRAENMVMLGAAAFLYPFPPEAALAHIEALFQAKGEKVVALNQRAFGLGQGASSIYREAVEAGLSAEQAIALCAHLHPGEVEPGAAARWAGAMLADPSMPWPTERVPATLAAAP
ncbi:MAG: indolepyruvate oxidoreductase subunit beta [Deltaproteobacteria bacterium]|nr:indolepyruvate oxidoreductase subunit beta [Deltaproteobacteria bacterium]